MACSCGGKRTTTTSGATYVYEVTAPDGAVTPYRTALEARTASRQAGGGTIRRRAIKST